MVSFVRSSVHSLISFVSNLLTEHVYDSLFLLFSRHSCPQLLSSYLHNSLFLVSHLPVESIRLLPLVLLPSIHPSNMSHSILSCRNTSRPIHLCLQYQYHIVLKILLSSWIMSNFTSYVNTKKLSNSKCKKYKITTTTTTKSISLNNGLPDLPNLIQCTGFNLHSIFH